MTQTSIIIAYVTTQDFPALRASVFGFEFGLGYSVLGFGLTERAHTGFLKVELASLLIAPFVPTALCKHCFRAFAILACLYTTITRTPLATPPPPRRRMSNRWRSTLLRRQMRW